MHYTQVADGNYPTPFANRQPELFSEIAPVEFGQTRYFYKKNLNNPVFYRYDASQFRPLRAGRASATFKRFNTVSSHLSSDIQIEGDLNCSTDLIFDGSIKGNITSKGGLTIGQNASVNGNLKAEKALIEGKVTGNGDFKSCRLSPTSVISGAVNTVSLQMEEGASLEGQCKVGKAKA